MTPHEIQRALRLITSKPQRQRFPITALAQLAGLSRETVYQARNGNGLTPRVVEVLWPLLRDILDGSLQACQERRSGRTSVFRVTCPVEQGRVEERDAPLRHAPRAMHAG